jgi:hypothetical protein
VEAIDTFFYLPRLLPLPLPLANRPLNYLKIDFAIYGFDAIIRPNQANQ